MRRDHADVPPDVREHDLGVEQRLDDPVQLNGSERGLEPVDGAAEAQQPHLVAAPQVRVGEPGGRAHRLVERPRGPEPRLGERIEEQHGGRVSLRMLLVDDERAAARRRLPVHTSHAVAGLIEPEIGELDPLALLPGDEVSDVGLGVARADDLAEPLLPRVDADEMSRGQLALEDEEAEPVEGRHAHAADPEHAPPRKAQRGRELARLAGGERERRTTCRLRQPRRVALRARARDDRPGSPTASPISTATASPSSTREPSTRTSTSSSGAAPVTSPIASTSTNGVASTTSSARPAAMPAKRPRAPSDA